MKNIQIHEGSPEIILAGYLPILVSEFYWDNDMFKAGLSALKIPDPVVETLQVDFIAQSITHLPVHTRYTHQANEMTVILNNTRQSAVLPSLTGAWQQVRPNVSGHVNFALARGAQFMADRVLSHPDTLQKSRGATRKERKEAERRLLEKALRFANSEHARDLFNGVVKIEFAK